MKPQLASFVIAAIFVTAGCDKSKTKTSDSETTVGQSTLPKLTASDGVAVREAATDHSLPPYIRQSAVVFERIMDGKEGDPKKIGGAIRELSATRNESTYSVWVAMLHASEARLPDVLPSKAEFAKLEKQKFEGSLKGIETNPLRFLDVLRVCIIGLTEFDMSKGDQEVAAFMKRFEVKYRTSDLGKHYVDSYRMEIDQTLERRKGGGVPWKMGRKVPNSEY